MTKQNALKEAFPSRLSDNELQIAEMLAISDMPGDWRPDALTLDRGLLDRVADGREITEDGYNELVWTEWVPNVSQALRWWNDLAWCALQDLLERHCDEEDIDRRLRELATLESALVSAIANARVEQFKSTQKGFEGKDSESGSLEIAKRYRLYTRRVESLLIETCPDLNRNLLFNPYPAWGYRAGRRSDCAA